MSWYKETNFYHIYPLGMLGCPKENDYTLTEHRLNNLLPWIEHLKDMGINGLYIGPLFESGSHGYDTTDYRKLDSRLGDNDDLRNFVSICHKNGIKVILDGVFNHTGRDFFAFKDIKENRENSKYINWYNNVNFYNNNSYDDGFSYDNWGGYDLLVKFNLKNPEVVDYLMDTVKYWIDEFDIDGLRLDTADVLDFDFMKTLRWTTSNYKEDFWLMGEVIHGEYQRWVNDEVLHSVTNYQLHKALFSGMNDHNFFEIIHTLNRQDYKYELYNFVDNHDTERIITKLNNKYHFLPVHTMLFTLPGIPSIYYGSELGIEGHKYKNGSDDEIRPYINIDDYKNCLNENDYCKIVSLLANFRKDNNVLNYGSFDVLELQTEYLSYKRELDGNSIYVFVSNSDNNHDFYIESNDSYIGLISKEAYTSDNGTIKVSLNGNSSEILYKEGTDFNLIDVNITEIKEEPKKEEIKKEFTVASKPYEEMSIEELQDAILDKMAHNGPINDQMYKSVRENVYKDSLLNWVKSFR